MASCSITAAAKSNNPNEDFNFTVNALQSEQSRICNRIEAYSVDTVSQLSPKLDNSMPSD